jgi:hypothetical protein
VIVSPAPAYPYGYPPPGPYAGGEVVAPPPLVLVPAPPMDRHTWSVALDALFLERSSGGSIPLGYTYYNTAQSQPANAPTGSIYSDDVYFPLSAGLRLEVNQKLDSNITLSATYWGLQQWSVGETLPADPYQDTVLAFSRYLQLPYLLNGLDNYLSYTYASQVDNVEFNVRFALTPHDPYWQLDWLAGIRYVYFADQFSLIGSDNANSATETLNYATTNHLVGPQIGLLFTQGWSRFEWDVGLKVGLMANIYSQHGTDTATGPSSALSGFNAWDISNNGCGLAALFEFTLGARYRLTDNLWLRLGFQVYDITGLALGPRQLDGWGHGANVAMDGLSIGLQATW